MSMQQSIQHLLRRPLVSVIARTALTFPFWGSGLAKLFDFEGGVAEMAHFGLTPPAVFNMATIIVQLGGSLLIIVNRMAWLGAGALGIFTGLTIFLVHSFWRITEEPFRTIAFHTATEHVGIIGGLIAIAILAIRAPLDTERPEVNRTKWMTS
jgi:transmembrane protein